MRTLLEASSNAAAPAAGVVSGQRSPWHSPVPYLFGGLAAMLGLIAFALLILACSYWRISGNPTDGGAEDGDVEKGAEEKGKEVVRVYEEKIVVIMAGDEKPTYLATPMCSRGSSFGDCERKNTEEDQETRKESDSFKKVNKNNNGADDAVDHHSGHVAVTVTPQESTEAPFPAAATSREQDDQ